MTYNIHEEVEIFTCTFEIEVSNQVQTEIIKAPRIMIERYFVSLVEQASQSSLPIKIKMSRTINIYDNFNDEWVERENNVVFKNNAYLNVNEQTK